MPHHLIRRTPRTRVSRNTHDELAVRRKHPSRLANRWDRIREAFDHIEETHDACSRPSDRKACRVTCDGYHRVVTARLACQVDVIFQCKSAVGRPTEDRRHTPWTRPDLYEPTVLRRIVPDKQRHKRRLAAQPPMWRVVERG